MMNQKEIRYTYDEYERISSITKDNKQITYEYDEYGRLQRENNENLDKRIVYEYNDIGNILNKKTYSYTTGELSNVINTKIYTYDNTGRIIRETNNYNYYDESTSNEIIEYLYDVNIVKGIRYTKGNTSRIYYLERNILGDVIEIYDTKGNIQVKYKYDGYGNCTIESDISEVSIGTMNPIRYKKSYIDI